MPFRAIHLMSLAYIICPNSRILNFSLQNLSCRSLLSLVTEKQPTNQQCVAWFNFSVACGIFRLYRKWPWQNPGDLIASPAGVPTLQPVSQVEPQRVSERFSFNTIRSVKSLFLTGQRQRGGSKSPVRGEPNAPRTCFMKPEHQLLNEATQKKSPLNG